MLPAETTKGPSRPTIRRMIQSGLSDTEIAESFGSRHRGQILFAIREIRSIEERKANPDTVNRRGPFKVLYTTSAGTPVYYVGGGHAIHGDYALKAMCFGPDAPRVEALEVQRPVVRVIDPVMVLEGLEPDTALEEGIVEDGPEPIVPPLEKGENVYDWVKRVARMNGLSPAALRSTGRRQKMLVTELRWRMICTIKQTRPSLSFPYIGKVFALDHTSVMHVLKKAKEGRP